MPTKKMRVEVFNNGDRYTVTFEGQITRDKALRVLDLVELLGGSPATNSEQTLAATEISKIDKVRLVAEKNFPVGWFSSKDMRDAFEKQYNEPISLSTASTYLSRLTDRGYFLKKGSSNQMRYRIMTALSTQIQER
ncbi:MAG: hypothetical protein IAX21_05145 [Candidatus Bathyarchaeota archaeon]|nr:MAG: hypothetical protein NUK63_00640 [Candidatus Bathyarchaeum tardum]WNZ30235.1 MAG: hypothetical protein IAX21_05145 [Candidatus Bathyarchaeota archaeon]